MQAGPSEFRRETRSGDLLPAFRMLLAGGTLTEPSMRSAFEAIVSGGAHHGEIGALLALLAARVPAAAELAGAAAVMREHVARVPTALDPGRIVDTAGTGGAPKTFNVSTAAAIIAAAAANGAVAVAKHGNRSRTGRGSAEVLAALGVNVDAPPEIQARCLEEAHLCFCFAIHHHPAAKHAMPVRLALGFPTIFNVLGPLTNPAGARRQLVGVYDKRLLQPVAEALALLGTERAMVVHSDDGLDEISITAPTTAMHVERGRQRSERIDPAALGVAARSLREVTAADLPGAAAMVRGVLEGTLRGPPRDMALLNAAATLVVGGVAASLKEGLSQSAAAVDGGHASTTLEALVEISKTNQV